jgi:hypothetical protein
MFLITSAASEAALIECRLLTGNYSVGWQVGDKLANVPINQLIAN